MSISIPPGLAAIANGRDHIQTGELAKAVSLSCHTIRVRHCNSGSFYGVKPIKIGGHLLWPVAEVAKLLNGGAQ